MAYKIQIENNFFVVIDTGTSAEIIREVRDQVKFSVSSTTYKFKWNYANGPDVSNQTVTEFDFSNIVDSTLTPFADQATLNAYLSSKIGKICCNPSTIDIDITDSASTTLYLLTVADGGSATQPIQDSNVTVNGNAFDSILAEGSLDVPVVNEGTNPVGTITGGEVVIANSEVTINTIQVGDIPAEDNLSIAVTLDGVPSGTWNAGTQTWEVVGVKDLFWELNFNGTDDIIFIPATVSNVGTLTSGTGSNVGTITVSTDGVTYGALSFPFTPTAATTYYFKRSTATVTGSYTMTGTYV